MPKLDTTNIENVPDILGVLNLQIYISLLNKTSGQSVFNHTF